jgi:hypothetical protein
VEAEGHQLEENAILEEINLLLYKMVWRKMKRERVSLEAHYSDLGMKIYRARKEQQGEN